MKGGMNIRRTIAIVIAIAGALSIGASSYINKEIEAGKGEITSGQQKVDAGRQLFDLAPGTGIVGDAVTESGQSRIDQGRRDVAHYEKLSKTLQVGGIVLIALGALIFIVKKRK